MLTKPLVYAVLTVLATLAVSCNDKVYVTTAAFAVDAAAIPIIPSQSFLIPLSFERALDMKCTLCFLQ